MTIPFPLSPVTCAGRAPCTARARRLAWQLVFASGLALVWACGENPLDEIGGGDAASFTRIYESDEFQRCSECHAPGAPARTPDIEATQDWSTRDKALSTLRGKASGLIGNFAECNGVPFLGGTAEESLLVASLDEETRANFSLPQFPDCTADAISLQTLKIGGDLPASLLQDLKDWVNAGAPGN